MESGICKIGEETPKEAREQAEMICELFCKLRSACNPQLRFYFQQHKNGGQMWELIIEGEMVGEKGCLM